MTFDTDFTYRIPKTVGDTLDAFEVVAAKPGFNLPEEKWCFSIRNNH